MARSPHLVLDGAVCAEALPELITLDDWGFPIVSGQACAPRSCPMPAKPRACPLVALRLERVNR
jgi:ferredoxin